MASSQITVGVARANYAYLVNPLNLNDPLFLQILNQVVERYITSATWKGTVMEAMFMNDTDGFITLDPNMDSLLAATVNGWPVPTFSEFQQFVEVGPGTVNTKTQCGWAFFDAGNRFCTQRDIPSGAYGLLRTALVAASDAGKTVRYMGADPLGNIIYDAAGVPGELVTLVNPTVDTVNQFSTVTGVIKDLTHARIVLNWMNGSTPTQIGVYQPNETIPQYHRYQVGTIQNEPIGVKAKRRFMQLYNETDQVIPGSLGGIFFGIQARLQEIAQNFGDALGNWKEGVRVLNEEHASSRGGASYSINFKPYGPGVRPVRNAW